MLERWITSSLFNGLEAEDEYSFCLELSEQHKAERLKSHRDSFITKDDFEWLAIHGIDCVRIPVGYWLFGGEPPFVGCSAWLDKAFDWADSSGMKVIIDFHAAPGSQNGNDHSGRKGNIQWSRPQNIRKSLEFVGRLSRQYHGRSNLYGIEVLNEPEWAKTKSALPDYYYRAYQEVRHYCPPDIAVIFSDAFQPLEWDNVLNRGEFKNVIQDTHHYQCFGREDNKLDAAGHMRKISYHQMQVLKTIDRPIIIGEWSLALGAGAYRGIDEAEKMQLKRQYAKAQLEIFNNTAGWFFWNYKTEDQGDWNFRHCLESGLITL